MHIRWEKCTLQLALDANPNKEMRILHIFNQDKPETPQQCSEAMAKTFDGLISELFTGETNEGDIKVGGQIILQAIQHICKHENKDGLPVLVANGLIEMIILKAMQEILSRLQEDNDCEYDSIYDDILQTITAIADNSNGRCQTFEVLGHIMLRTIISEDFRFVTKIETLKSFNMLLEGCPYTVRENFRDSPINSQTIKNLASHLLKFGDYEFQVGIIECLFRLTNKGNRASFVKKWIAKPQYAKAFLKIRDSEFETDCRMFLNELNQSGVTGVYSIGCTSLLLGTYQLEKPTDASYQEFWIDFNVYSRRLTVFCSQMPTLSQEDEVEEGMWETVSIADSNVVNFKLIRGQKNTVELNLTCPVRDLINLGPAIAGSTITINFPADVDVTEPLLKTLDASKLVKTKQSGVKSSGPINYVRISFGSPSQSQASTQASTMVKEAQKSVPNMRKVSVPQTQMSTPAGSTVQPASKYKPLTMVHTPSRNKFTPTKAFPAAYTDNTIQGDLHHYPASTSHPDIVTLPAEKANDALSEISNSFHRKMSVGLPVSNPRIDPGEVIPSSCPDENFMVPDSQERGLPLGYLNPTGLGFVTPSDQEVEDYDKSIRKGQMAALKNHLSATDPSYTSIPVNVHKVSNTPSLSTVTEESHRQTPDIAPLSKTMLKTHSTMGPIPEGDEEVYDQTNKTSKIPKEDPQPAKRVSPDSTTDNRTKRAPNRKPPQPKNTQRKNAQKQAADSQEAIKKPKSTRSKTRGKGKVEEEEREVPNDIMKNPGSKAEIYKTQSDVDSTRRSSRRQQPAKNGSTEDKVKETTEKVNQNKPENHTVKASEDSDFIESSQLEPVPNPKKPMFFKARYRERMEREKQAQTIMEQSQPPSMPHKKTPIKKPPLTKKEKPKEKRPTEKAKKEPATWKTPVVNEGESRRESGSSEKRSHKKINEIIEISSSPPMELSQVYDFETCVGQTKDTGDKMDEKSNMSKSKQPKNKSTKEKDSNGKKKNAEKNAGIETDRFYNQNRLPVSPDKPSGILKDKNMQRKKETYQKPKSKPEGSKAKKPAAYSDEDFDIVENSNSAEVEETTRNIHDEEVEMQSNLSEFTKMCQGMIDNSKKVESTRRTNKKPVCYKDLSDSEIENTSASTVEPVSEKRPGRRTSFDPMAIDNEKPKSGSSKVKTKRSKNVFSDTEDGDNLSVRSELSWLGSTARKQKTRPPLRAYKRKTAQARNPRPMLTARPADSDSLDETDIHKRPKKKPRKERVKDKVQYTSDEGSENELYYTKPRSRSKKKGQNKENESSKRTQTPRSNQAASGGSCGQKPQKKVLQVIATSNTPLQDDIDDIETMRREYDIQTTPYLIESPGLPYQPITVNLISQEVKLPDYEDMELDVPASRDNEPSQTMEYLSQRSEITHISPIKTPKTPRTAPTSSEGDSEPEMSKRKMIHGKNKKSAESSKRRKKVKTPETTPETSSCESEKESEEEELSPVKEPKFSESFLKSFQPRRLFHKPSIPAPVDNDEEEVPEEEEPEEEEEHVEEEKVEEEEEEEMISLIETKPSTTDGLSVNSMLRNFGMDFKKNVEKKKQFFEQATKVTIKSTQKKIHSLWCERQTKRNDEMESFDEILINEVNSLEKDVMDIKQTEEAAEAFNQKQVESLRRIQNTHLRRLHRLKKKGLAYIGRVQAVEKEEQSQQTSVKDILKKDMQVLQTKLMQQLQQQELTNMRKTLHSLFL